MSDQPITAIDLQPVTAAMRIALLRQLQQHPNLQAREEQSSADIYALEEALETAVARALAFFCAVDGSQLELVNTFEEHCEANGLSIQWLELEELSSND